MGSDLLSPFERRSPADFFSAPVAAWGTTRAPHRPATRTTKQEQLRQDDQNTNVLRAQVESSGGVHPGHWIGQASGIFSLKHESCILRSVIQPSMRYLHEETGYALYCLSHGELACHLQNHIQMTDLNMLLSCFREKMPDRLGIGRPAGIW